MGRKIKTRSVGVFVKALPWDQMKSVKQSKQLYRDCLMGNKTTVSERDRLRFWTARAFCLARADKPGRYMQWLMKNPDAELPQWAEDSALQLLRGKRVTKEGTDTAKIGTLLPGS